MVFQNLLIADFHEGQRLDKESWLQPNNAFSVLENVYLRRGIIHKRFGYSLFSQFGTSYLETIGGTPATVYNFVLANLPVIPGSLYVSDSVEYFTDDGNGVLTGSQGGNGTIVYSTGTLSVTFNSATSVAPTASYQKAESNADLTVRGIFNLESSIASDRCIVMDQQKLLEYNSSSKTFVAKPDSTTGLYNYFGSVTKLIQGIGYLGKLYFTDGLNPTESSGIWAYNPTGGLNGDVTKFEPQIGATSASYVKKALIIRPYYRRLVMFNTVEQVSGDTNYRQRARWSSIDGGDNVVNWRADIPGLGSSRDAATNEEIVSAGIVKGIMVVAFERSIWVLQDTANASSPFRWRHLEGGLKIGATFGTVETENMIIFIGEGGIYGCDGVQVEELSKKIPDFTLEEIDIEAYSKCSAVYDHRLKQILLTYPSNDLQTGENTRMKVIGIDEGWFTDYDYGMVSTGNYTNNTDTTWNDVIAKHGDSWNEIAGLTGYDISQQNQEDIILGGSTNGYIYKLNDTLATDDEPLGVSTKFNFIIESKDYTQFIEEVNQIVLGYLDIYNSSVTSASYTVYLKCNGSDGSYKAQKVTTNGVNKIWKRVVSRQLANSHSFKITLDTPELLGDSGYIPFKFHAFNLGIRPDGQVRLS